MHDIGYVFLFIQSQKLYFCSKQKLKKCGRNILKKAHDINNEINFSICYNLQYNSPGLEIKRCRHNYYLNTCTNLFAENL